MKKVKQEFYVHLIAWKYIREKTIVGQMLSSSSYATSGPPVLVNVLEIF